MKNNKLLVYLLATFAMLFWSFSFIWIKIAFRLYRPLTIIFIRLIIATVILIIFEKLLKKKKKIRKEDMKTFFLLAFLEPFCYFIGESFGMQYVQATLGAIIISTIPLFTPIFSRIFLKEKITKFTIIGIIGAFLGVVLILYEDFKGESSLLGIFLLIFAVFSGINFGILLKKISHKYSSITIIKTQSYLGLLYFFPLFMIFDFQKAIAAPLDLQVLSSIFALGLFGSSLAFIFMTIAVRNIGVTNANVFANLIPVFTAVISYYILGEPLILKKVIGIVIVVISLFLSQLPKLFMMYRTRKNRAEI